MEATLASTGNDGDDMTSGTVVRNLYDAFARGDAGAVLAAFDPAIEWNEAESFRYADRNPYRGPGAIGEGVFQRIGTDLENFSVTPERFIDAGDAVAVEGRYRGTVRATGRAVVAQFAHIWRIRDGKVVGFQQYTDTKQWSDAFGS
jgi:hypothetical protein